MDDAWREYTAKAYQTFLQGGGVAIAGPDGQESYVYPEEEDELRDIVSEYEFVDGLSGCFALALADVPVDFNLADSDSRLTDGLSTSQTSKPRRSADASMHFVTSTTNLPASGRSYRGLRCVKCASPLTPTPPDGTCPIAHRTR